MTNTLTRNIKWTIEQAAAFIAEAKQKSTNQRSRYYKAAFLLSASAVEAVEFVIIKSHCLSNNRIKVRKEYRYKQLHKLPDNLFSENPKGIIGIYKKEEKDFHWKDNIDFKTMNEIGYRNNFFNKRLYNKLEKIREKRNRIHIQSLESMDHKYTKKDIEYVSSALPELLDYC